jgi:hypothetical protein
MGLFRRRKSSGSASQDRTADKTDRKHLEDFVNSHRGVEAFVEPRTAVTETTVVLVAADGEWTRRRVPDPATLHSWANSLGIPSYDAGVVGYPQRMRDYNARIAAERKRRLNDIGRVDGSPDTEGQAG